MRNKWVGVLVVALFVGGVLSIAASSLPDGLESVAEQQGFFARETVLFPGVIPDYAMSGFHHSLATPFSGIAGVLMVFLILSLLGKRLYRE